MVRVWECGFAVEPRYRVTDDERQETYVLPRMDALHGRSSAQVQMEGGYRKRDEVAADILWDWSRQRGLAMGVLAPFAFEVLRPIGGSTRYDVREDDLERWFLVHLYSLVRPEALEEGEVEHG